ncbi:MAG: aminotransferase class IV, partial [Candidatus Binatia bacterium]
PRRKTLRLARRIADVREERFTIAELLAADEVFLTASSIEVVPVVRVAGKRIGNGRPGPITLDVQRRYREVVARKLGLAIGDLGD